jgi:hypothetical protein
MLTVCTSTTQDDLVFLEDVQELLNAPSSDEAYLARLITRTSKWAETYVGFPLLAQTYVESVPGTGLKSLLLARTPIRSIAKIIEGSSSTEDGTILDSTSYYVEDADAGIIRRDSGFTWAPQVSGGIADAIVPGSETRNFFVEYEAGYLFPGDETTGPDIPPDIQQAVIEKVAQLYERSGQVASKRLGDYSVNYRTDGPDGPAQLLDPYVRTA